MTFHRLKNLHRKTFIFSEPILSLKELKLFNNLIVQKACMENMYFFANRFVNFFLEFAGVSLFE